MSDLMKLAQTIWEHLDTVLMAIGAVVTASTALVAALQGLIALIKPVALGNSIKWDDQALDTASGFLASVLVWLRKTQKAIRPMAVRGTGDKVKDVKSTEQKE